MLAISNDYIGKIVNAELQENEGKLSAVVIVRPDGDTQTARWFGSFSDTVISKGDNAGKVVGELTAATLGKFGCVDFAKIGALIGMPVAFGVKHRTDDKGKVWADVNFIRPPGSGKPATSAGLASLAKFRGAAIDAAKNAPKPPAVSKPPMRELGDDSYDNEFDPLA